MKKLSNFYNSPIRVLYLVTMLYYTAPYIILAILPIQMARLGFNKEIIGLVMGSAAIATMLFRPLVGYMVDKFGGKKLFLAALVIDPLALAGFFSGLVQLFTLSRMIIGMGSSLFSSSIQVLAIKLVATQYRQKSMSLYALFSRLPEAFAPAIALYLINYININYILAIAILCSLSALFFGRKLAKHFIINKQQSNSHSHEYIDQWKNRFLAISALTMLIVSLTNGAVTTFLPLYLIENKQQNFAPVYFLIFSGTILLLRIYFSKRLSHKADVPTFFVLLMTLSSATGSFLIAYSTSALVCVCAAICQGITFAGLYPTLATFVSFRAPATSMALRLSLFTGAADFGIALGAILLGFILQITSYKVMFLTCALTATASGLIFFTIAGFYRWKILKIN